MADKTVNDRINIENKHDKKKKKNAKGLAKTIGKDLEENFEQNIGQFREEALDDYYGGYGDYGDYGDYGEEGAEKVGESIVKPAEKFLMSNDDLPVLGDVKGKKNTGLTQTQGEVQKGESQSEQTEETVEKTPEVLEQP